MDLSNNSMSFSSSSILSWCINDTVDPEAIVTGSDIETYGDVNLTLSELCNIENPNNDLDEETLPPSEYSIV